MSTPFQQATKRIAAGALFLDQQQRVLLVNPTYKTHWEIPGGMVEEKEAPDEACRREISEELGVSVSIIRHLGSRGFEQDGRVMDYQWYLGEITGRPQVMEPDTFDDLAYFNVAELNAIAPELSANAQNFLHEVLAGRISID